MNNEKIKQAIDANIAVHSAMAEYYNQVEPHFRSESTVRVEAIIQSLISESSVVNALDLGCGTGFMINFLKKYANRIVGVDVTKAMLEKVDLTGNAKIELINSDTGTVKLPMEHFDLVTAYSFLDHLYDLRPTINKAYESLKHGGNFYADLCPNYYFWKAIKELNKDIIYEPVIQREVNAVWNKGEEIELKFGVNKDTFVAAEYQKHVRGGLKEEDLADLLSEVGFTNIKFVYHWFIGQAQLVNNELIDKIKRDEYIDVINNYLNDSLPIAKSLYKYVGFIATK